MGTLTVANIINNVRSDLNETTTTVLSDAELTIILNDAYKDVATKGLCFEGKIAIANIPALQKIIDLTNTTITDPDYKIIRVNYVEYKSGATQGGVGLMCVLPQAIGYIPAELVSTTNGTGTPQYWFQWGNCLIIEPVPDVATYDLEVYATCYPQAVRVATSADIAAGDVPVEFQECIYLFTLVFAALKLRRWGDAANAYNKYIISVQQKRAEFVSKYPDYRSSHELPDNVTMQEQQQRGQ
ncbi:MAG: hypothetical protein V1709_03875 [Planctomycetota bacterium]